MKIPKIVRKAALDIFELLPRDLPGLEVREVTDKALFVQYENGLASVIPLEEYEGIGIAYNEAGKILAFRARASNPEGGSNEPA
jgi:hypothetical protein